MAQVHTSTPVMLLLPPSELWTLYHVLLDRFERIERRSPAVFEPPPTEVYHTLEKIEAGESWFTPSELLSTRAELKRYLDHGNGAPSKRATIERIIDRITQALYGPRENRPHVGRRRRRPHR